MKKYLVKLADHLDKKGLHKEADYVDWILKQSNDENVICKANNLENCAVKIKKAVLGGEPGKKTVSLKELNEMFDFYKNTEYMIKVTKKGMGEISKGFEKFKLSGESYDHDRLNYHPFRMKILPIVIE